MIGEALERSILGQLRSDEPQTREAGLHALFDATRGPLFALALRMTGAADRADDAVQETFVDVLRSARQFRGEARLTTWLFRIAVRAAVRVSQKSRRQPPPLPDDLVGAGDQPAETLAQREGAARILTALAALPPPQRAVLSLSALQELPQTEIAEILGVPVGTVYSRLHQARERLRATLERPR